MLDRERWLLGRGRGRGEGGAPRGGRTDKSKSPQTHRLGAPPELGHDRALSAPPSRSHSCLCPSPPASLCLGPATAQVSGGCGLPVGRLGEAQDLSS